MRMNLLYVHSNHLGYGRFGVKVSAALRDMGITVCDDLPNADGVDYSAFKPKNAYSGTCGHVSFLSTPGHCQGWWEGQSVSLWTMWEATYLPETFRENIDSFETVVVPSEQNVELFSPYHPNVKYVPLGIDPNDWHPIPRPGLDGPWFNFLICGGGYRKGTDLVVRAFLELFGEWSYDKAPVPRLIIKSPRVDERSYQHDRIEVIGGFLDDAEEIGLYSLAHVYVQPSRGEGFGLQPLQAIAQGCPTIATAAHGHMAYAHLMTYQVPAAPVPTPPESFHQGPAGAWWEPDYEVLRDAMLDAYENYEDRLTTARFNAQVAVETMTWRHTAEQYLDAIGRHNLELPDVVPTKWVTPILRRYRIRVLQPSMCEIGGVQRLFIPRHETVKDGKFDCVCSRVAETQSPLSRPLEFLEDGSIGGRLRCGHDVGDPIDYWEPADVKRIFFTNGNLDPDCLKEIDHGLLPEQVERIPHYTAAHSLCPTCKQRLNTNAVPIEEGFDLPVPR